MKISQLYKQNRTVISFEVFPPKKDDDIRTLYDALSGLSVFEPDFISVTFGAGGGRKGTSATAEIVRHIKDKHGIEALAHITCSGMKHSDVAPIVKDFRQKGISNLLALRGDEIADGGFVYAKDFIAELKNHDFCIGAAAYPEGHITCSDLNKDISHLKQKQDAGADFFITQLFFDNDCFYRFLDKARAVGVSKPISAGIMPMLSKAQIQRMIFMCGASLPAPIIKIIGKYGDEGESLVKAGMEYAYNQMQDLCDNGVDGIHMYIMNKPSIAEYCLSRLKVKRV
ncbi:MAG: methylenetetrahydrofolate reductase [Firmicutes bacterium]|nr:methylenetetrahydrofolate reductase [Bacillota bacterium]